MSDDKEINRLIELCDHGNKIPPVNDWSPERKGTIDIRISSDGKWWYQGELMERLSVVRLLSTLLRKDDAGYWLVTPAEMLQIKVDDAPFIASEMERIESDNHTEIAFITNVKDKVCLDRDHGLKWVEDNENQVPYVEVRYGLYAKLSRPVYYELAGYAIEQDGQYFVKSGDMEFELY